MRISRHDLRRRYSNSLVIDAEEAGQLSRENLDQWNRSIFPSCLRRFLAFKFALNTEALKKYIEIFKFFYQNATVALVL
jgi:hypothetical protein